MHKMKLTKLTEKEKEVLKKLVKYACQSCGKRKKKENLEIHRIKRGNVGGEYTIDNVKIVCKNCHKLIHYNEY